MPRLLRAPVLVARIGIVGTHKTPISAATVAGSMWWADHTTGCGSSHCTRKFKPAIPPGAALAPVFDFAAPRFYTLRCGCPQRHVLAVSLSPVPLRELPLL